MNKVVNRITDIHDIIGNKNLIKYKVIIVLYLFLSVCTYAEGLSDERTTTDTSDEEILISKFKTEFHYYGLPLAAKLGWFYRKNNFSIFPNIGASFRVDELPVINISSGFILRNRFFDWDVNAVYNVLPFTLNKPADEQVIYGSNSFGLYVDRIRLSFPLYAGRQERTLIGPHKDGTEGSKKITVTEVSAGLDITFFFIDTGLFKSTGSARFLIDAIPKDRFISYRLDANILGTFYLYYADIACMYSVFNTEHIPLKGKMPKHYYELGKTQAALTGRTAFKKMPKYMQIHLFRTEIRVYPVRAYRFSNSFCLSVFADIGFGISKDNKRTFLAEYGLGAGYTLFDDVPFTFQIGMNQNMQPVFFLGIVSTLSHRP